MWCCTADSPHRATRELDSGRHRQLENGLLAEHWDVLQDEATAEDP